MPTRKNPAVVFLFRTDLVGARWRNQGDEPPCRATMRLPVPTAGRVARRLHPLLGGRVRSGTAPAPSCHRSRPASARCEPGLPTRRRAAPWPGADARCTRIAGNNHNNHPLPLEIKVMIWGPLLLPAMTAIWMYVHKRGGGMRGLMDSTAMTLVAIPTNLVAFEQHVSAGANLEAAATDDGIAAKRQQAIHPTATYLAIDTTDRASGTAP